MLWLALAYPLLAHIAVTTGERRWMWLALEVLLIVTIANPLMQRRPWAWIALIALSMALYALTVAGGGQYLLFVPPVAIPAMLLVIFARSLLPNATPVVTRIAESARGPLPNDMRLYARHITLLWALSFALLATADLLFALFATKEVWSLAANFAQYIVIGGFFFTEYVYRRWRFRHHTHPGIREYLGIVRRINFRSLVS